MFGCHVHFQYQHYIQGADRVHRMPFLLHMQKHVYVLLCKTICLSVFIGLFLQFFFIPVLLLMSNFFYCQHRLLHELYQQRSLPYWLIYTSYILPESLKKSVSLNRWEYFFPNIEKCKKSGTGSSISRLRNQQQATFTSISQIVCHILLVP